MQASKRLPALDTLRAFAILWVLLHHAQPWFRQLSGNEAWFRFLRFGHAGVDLFFVLSGYLIAGILLGELRNTGGLNLPRFWYRRWMRTLPAYYVVLAILVASELLGPPHQLWPRFWSYLAFLQTYLNDENSCRFIWAWSLCVEELFYLTLPVLTLVLCLAVRKARPEVVLRIIAAAAFVVSLLSRCLLIQQLHNGQVSEGQAEWRLFMVPHFRLDGLAMGVFLATLRKPNATPVVAAVSVVALVGLGVLIFSPLSEWVAFHQFAVLALAFGTLTYAGVGDNAWSRLNIPGARFVADISYSLYLMHPIVEKAVARWFPQSHPAFQLALFFAASIAAAAALRFAVELPFLKLRDRIAKAREKKADLATSGSDAEPGGRASPPHLTGPSSKLEGGATDLAPETQVG